MTQQNTVDEITFKIILVGQQHAGKTALLYNYIKGQFKQQYNVTVGVQFCSNTVQIQDNLIRLQIWDTAGQQTFKSIVRSFYKGASAVLLIYSIQDEKSFQCLNDWIKEIQQHANQQVCIFLVGTKLDKAIKRKIQKQQAQNYLKQIGGICFIQTSAKTGQNIETLFKMAANIMYKKYKTSKKYRQLVTPDSNYTIAEKTRRSNTMQSFTLKTKRQNSENINENSKKKCC